MFKRFMIVALILVSVSAALTSHVMAEIPYGETLQVILESNATLDANKTCTAAFYRQGPYIGTISVGGGSQDDWYALNTTRVVARVITPANITAGNGHIGYTLCAWVKTKIGDPMLRVVIVDAGDVLPLGHLGAIHTSLTGEYQCVSISHDSCGCVGTQVSDYTLPGIGVQCLNCEVGVNEAYLGLDTSTSGDTYYSDNDGGSWSALSGSDSVIKLTYYVNPSDTGMLVKYSESLSETQELMGSFRGIPLLTDLDRYQSRLIMSEAGFTNANLKVKEPFVVGDYGYYFATCGNETTSNIFKIVPTINLLDGGYNLMQNVYQNMGLLVVGAFLSVIFAVIGLFMLTIVGPIISLLLSSLSG